MRPAPSGRSHYLGPAAQRRNGTGHSAPNHDADANYEFAGQFDQKRRATVDDRLKADVWRLPLR